MRTDNLNTTKPGPCTTLPWRCLETFDNDSTAQEPGMDNKTPSPSGLNSLSISPAAEARPALKKSFVRFSPHLLHLQWNNAQSEDRQRRSHVMGQGRGPQSSWSQRELLGPQHTIDDQQGLGSTDACDPPPADAHGPTGVAVAA